MAYAVDFQFDFLSEAAVSSVACALAEGMIRNGIRGETFHPLSGSALCGSDGVDGEGLVP